MRQWLIRQRTKPKHVRDNIAFGFASGAVVLALAGWLLFVPKGEVFHSNVADDTSPEAFSTFFSQVKEQVAGVRESIKEQATTTASAASSTVTNSTYTNDASTTREAVIYVIPSASSTATGTSTAQ